MSQALEFRVLGPVEVVVNGVATRIGSPSQRTLLALLLMRPNEPLSTDRIAEVLWPDEPAEAHRRLWFHVSKLRSLLHPHAASDMLVTQPTGYLLRVDRDQLDSTRFEHLARSAHALLEDDPARAAEMLRRGLGLWRGRPFEDVLPEDAVAQQVVRLNALRLAAMEDRVDADLAVGRDAELIPELEALVTEDPYRERFRAQLMLALYRAGRQADALAAYRQAWRALDEELGIEPGEGLKQLEQRILSHDPELGGARMVPHRAAARREERKLVTVLFAELVGSTANTEEPDPEDVRALLLPYHTRLRSDLERFGGTVERFIGDEVVAFFGAPATHEDDAERAVRAALTIRDWLVERGDGLQARIGVATGQALVTLGAPASPAEPMAVGDVVKNAANLRIAAPSRSVLVDEQTFRRTRDAIEYRDAAMGTNRSVSAWEAMRPLAQPGVDLSRHRAPFVGRERELAALHERLAWAAAQASPQLVTIVGVPGIGKTRLVAELQQAARADTPLTWRQGRTLPYGDGVSFWALREIVKAEAGILESDPTDQVERKLGKAVDRIVEDRLEAQRIVTSLGVLIGLSGGATAAPGPRGEAFSRWRNFLEAVAHERTLVLVFEDLHWADEGLLDFLDELLDRASGVRLLVLATARPELLERRPHWAGGKPNALTMSLPPLSESDTARLVAGLLAHPVPGAETQETLLARVGGNPLYAEQFCRIVLERGRLEQLPETVHGIIAARLDLLADAEKRLLQDAAVVGRVFWLGALVAVGGVSREDADELLHGLARRDFIGRARRSSVAGDIEYTFAHELVRDVAYGEIPRADRVLRHRRAAEWIDSLGRPEDHAELLAHHYVCALEYARSQDEDPAGVVRRAVQALHSAGLQAMRMSANDRAVEHFSRAIGLVERLPEGDERSATEVGLQLQLGMALFAMQGFSAPGVERAYGRATELMMASVPTAEQFPLQFGLSIFHGHRGNFDRSIRLVNSMTKLASKTSKGDESMRLQALHARWMNSLFGGRIDDAVVATDKGWAIYRSEDHHATSFLYGNHDPGVCALALQALALALRGESVRAVTQMREAIALGQALGHAVSLAQALTQLPWVLQLNGDAPAALAEAERALALEDGLAHPQFFGIARAMRGWALAHLGHGEEGVADLEKAIATELQASPIWAAMIGALLAEIHLREGRLEAGRSLLDQTRTLIPALPAYFYTPELLRVEAEWLRLTNRAAQARSLLFQSIEIARQHGSWALAVRSALALARAPSAHRSADLQLLGDLYGQLPMDNATDYGRATKALLSESA